MREIKFRVWVESVLPEETGIYYPSVLTLYKGEASMVADKIFAEKGNDRFKFKDDTCKFTLMQYTGLKDKTGVDIYDGDIMHLALDDENGEVIFSHGCFYLKWQCTPEHRITTSLFDINDDNEVIGNIWENPELLK